MGFLKRHENTIHMKRGVSSSHVKSIGKTIGARLCSPIARQDQSCAILKDMSTQHQAS